jgi:hypothetical protein
MKYPNRSYLAAAALFMVAAGLAPVASGTESRVVIPRGAAVVFSDPLFDGKCSGRVVGGAFERGGWRSLGAEDQLHYVLPEGSMEGGVEFEVANIDLPAPGDPRKHFWGLYDSFQTRNEVKRDDPGRRNAAGLTFRVYAGQKDSHGIGATRLRMDGEPYPKKAQSDNETLQWDAGKWYRFRITWTQTEAVVSRDGEVVGKISYPDRGLSLRHLYINNDNHHVFKGLAGAVYRNVVIWSGTGSAR